MDETGNQSTNPPILVTGAHRSGTTWVGKMLAASPQVGYISEPLNVLHRPGVMRAPVQHWYTYICKDNEDKFLPALQETVQFKYHSTLELNSLRSFKDVLRMGRDGSSFLQSRLLQRRALLKDPFAVFSALWFAQRLHCKVVIIVRHPAAFVSSLVRLDWSFDFSDLLAQPLLMRDWLEPFRSDMEAMIGSDEDIIGESCLLWRMVYYVVYQFKTLYPDFQIVRHEDLSLNPLIEFNKLLKSLSLRVTTPIQETILNSTSPQNPKEGSRRRVYSVQLDSRSNLNNWKYRLASEEIDRVRELTADVASFYYTDEEWA